MKLRTALVSAVAVAGVGSALFASAAYAATPNDDSVIKLVGENGLCLTVASAATGSVAVQTQCLHAHNFVWDRTHHNIYVQGHAGSCLASGDPNMSLFIDPCSNGRSVIDEDGADGTDIRFRWRNVGTFAHANGDGNPVQMITDPGNSKAVFWDPDYQ